MNTTICRALLVIDVQREYVDGALQIKYPDIQISLNNIAKAMDAANKSGLPIIVIQHAGPPNSPIFASGNQGFELHGHVTSRPFNYLVTKTWPNAFTDTELTDMLIQLGVNTLSVVGYMTQNCVDSTIRHAFHSGYNVEYLQDASGAVGYQNSAGLASAEEIHRAFCVVLQSRFAAVMKTDEWLHLITTGGEAIRDSIYLSARQAGNA